jgi:hypothetical protein
MRKLRLPLFALLLPLSLHAEEAKPAETPPSSPAAPSPAAPVDWHKVSARKLKDYVRTALSDGRFAELDGIMTEVNDQQLRFLDGEWKLTACLDALSTPQKRDKEDDWKPLLEALTAWDHHSHNVYSGNAVARTKLNFAFFIRTDAPSKDVTKDQWKIFNEAVAYSLETYNDLLKEPAKCVDMYAQLLRIGLAQGWPADRMQQMLAAAMAIAPDYYPCYQIVGYYTLEKWHGKPGASRAFLDSILEMVPGARGLEIYTRTAIALHPYFGASLFAKDSSGCADWKKMKQGFEAILSRFPQSVWHRNLFAAYACVAKDRATAQTLFGELTARSEVVAQAWAPAGGLEASQKWMAEKQ